MHFNLERTIKLEIYSYLTKEKPSSPRLDPEEWKFLSSQHFDSCSFFLCIRISHRIFG